MESRRSVLITGAVRNTGLAVAEKFMKEGWVTFITSRVENDAQAKAAELQSKYGVECFGFGFDPRNAKEEAEGLFARIKDKGYVIDTLVCAATNLGRWQNPLTVDLSAWEDVILTNILGYFAPARIMAREAVNAGKAGTATIVFIGSINHQEVPPERSAYASSKGAIRSLTRALAVDLAQYGIRVNCVMPGAIWTTRYDAMTPEEAARIEATIPLGKAATTSQVANGVYFFATDASGNATGTSFDMDGGLTCVVPTGY